LAGRRQLKAVCRFGRRCVSLPWRQWEAESTPPDVNRSADKD
jgi:hypothetical protein